MSSNFDHFDAPHPVLSSTVRQIVDAIEDAVDQGASIQDIMIMGGIAMAEALIRKRAPRQYVAESFREIGDAVDAGYELAPQASNLAN